MLHRTMSFQYLNQDLLQKYFPWCLITLPPAGRGASAHIKKERVERINSIFHLDKKTLLIITIPKEEEIITWQRSWTKCSSLEMCSLEVLLSCMKEVILCPQCSTQARGMFNQVKESIPRVGVFLFFFFSLVAEC